MAVTILSESVDASSSRAQSAAFQSIEPTNIPALFDHVRNLGMEAEQATVSRNARKLLSFVQEVQLWCSAAEIGTAEGREQLAKIWTAAVREPDASFRTESVERSLTLLSCSGWAHECHRHPRQGTAAPPLVYHFSDVDRRVFKLWLWLAQTASRKTYKASWFLGCARLQKRSA